MTRTFLKLLDFFQSEYKSWDSPTAEPETNAEGNRHLKIRQQEDSTVNTEMMLCSHGFQSGLSPFMDFYLPAHSLRSEVRPLFQRQHLLQRDLQELSSALQLMDKLQHDIKEQKEPSQSSVAMQPASYQLAKEGELFGLTLDTRGFSPEDLSVRQVGRKLRVSGKTQKKEEDGRGWRSYRLQEFSQEFDLPEGVNPEAVCCCMSPDGKLHIQAAEAPCAEEVQRELTIKRSSEEEPQQSVCPQAEDDSTETHNNTLDQPQHMD